MTPGEELKIKKKERTAMLVSVIIAFALALIAFVIVVVFFGLPDETNDELISYSIWLLILILSSYLIGRIYRKNLERKLGRKLKNEYELTSLKSWMSVSQRDDSQKPDR
jgi:L-asparagine transporter-like permease